jgi:hypothetical protein
MSDDQLTPLPASFLALHTGARGRLLTAAATVRARYELCEDLAGHLVSSAQGLHHDDGLAEDDVLARIHAGLANPESGMDEGEASWVVQRLAELLRWQDAWPA